mmetsp:Transcript_19057/g.54128  ORF Transcript_19057/g.54128 Transcript_19057/m.54128 type:complete len:94 (+) Transcript_19057:94-375(+)
MSCIAEDNCIFAFGRDKMNKSYALYHPPHFHPSSRQLVNQLLRIMDVDFSPFSRQLYLPLPRLESFLLMFRQSIDAPPTMQSFRIMLVIQIII